MVFDSTQNILATYSAKLQNISPPPLLRITLKLSIIYYICESSNLYMFIKHWLSFKLTPSLYGTIFYNNNLNYNPPQKS